MIQAHYDLLTADHIAVEQNHRPRHAAGWFTPRCNLAAVLIAAWGLPKRRGR